MSKVKTRQGSSVFRPRARIIRTLGRDLITNEVVALQELVKNSYDADAKSVVLTFEGPLEAGQGAIEVLDNGDGMTLETVQTSWMEPATDSKVKKQNSRTGRRVTGEKGIGRFAAARVAKILDLRTRARGGRTEVHVRFDWGAFEDESLFLDEVKCRWEEQPRRKGARSGTTLRLIELNDAWTDDSFATLRAELSRLVSPIRTPDTFEIQLQLPEGFEEYAGPVSAPPVLGKPHYKLTGRVTERGVIEATYSETSKERPFERPKESALLEAGRPPRIRLKGDKEPRCGPFEFEFRVWDREPKDLNPLARELNSTVRNLRRDLNAACGISIYRDRFRVLLPANEDFLRLDLRRVQNPTMRISNNQIVGLVSISADENPGLKDQTNRQGIVDSSAYDDFKKSLLEVLSKLESRRDSTRRGRRPKEPEAGIFQQLDFAPIRAFVQDRYPKDEKLRKFLDEKGKAFEHGVSEVQKVVARYRRLATLGQLIDVVLHEGRTPVATISNEVVLTRRDVVSMGAQQCVERLEARLDTIARQTEVLTGLFRRLAPFSGRKRGRPTEVSSQVIIKKVFELHKKKIEDLGVEVDLPRDEIRLTVDEAEMQMILWNLLDNALYWLDKVPKSERKIVVRTERAPQELRITFSDSGPGVPEEIQDRIFDPYFSSKPDGVGLGLTIAGETAAEYDGGLELLADGPLPGATFCVILRKRIGNEADG